MTETEKKTVNINMRMDKDMKEKAEKLFAGMGLTMSGAFKLFITQTLLKGKLPFEVEADPFWSPENQARLAKSIADAEAGKFVKTVTLEELEAMTNENKLY
jgi:DNA-damage-inducible protein J